jgi:hypothetical protein
MSSGDQPNRFMGRQAQKLVASIARFVPFAIVLEISVKTHVDSARETVLGHVDGAASTTEHMVRSYEKPRICIMKRCSLCVGVGCEGIIETCL